MTHGLVSLCTMKTNVGGWDRNLRWVIGSGALAAGLLGRFSWPWRVGLLLVGATDLITASTRYCPLNEALGVNTAAEGLKSELRSAVESVAS